jgi:hypothetical protein
MEHIPVQNDAENPQRPAHQVPLDETGYLNYRPQYNFRQEQFCFRKSDPEQLPGCITKILGH